MVIGRLNVVYENFGVLSLPADFVDVLGKVVDTSDNVASWGQREGLREEEEGKRILYVGVSFK